MRHSGIVTRLLAAAAGAGAVVAAASHSAASPDPIELIGVGTLPGTTSDGLVNLVPATLEDGTPHDRVGGFGSALAYTGFGGRYIAAPDRGPADGTTSYLDRCYELDIQVTPGAATPVTLAVTKATLLTNEQGQGFTGNAGAFDATNSPASRRLDPEGVRVGPKGTFFLSDEYGPFLYEFDAAGRRLRALAIPSRFLIDHPNANGADELPSPPANPPGNTKGRQSNRGMEGLAISPDGTKLFGLMQSPLIQDGALNASNQRRGLNCRLLEIDVATGATREFLYQLDAAGLGVNEILAVNDHQFLVIERDGNAGAAAAVKKIHKVDLVNAGTPATDISGIANLPQTGTPAGVTPVAKSLFIDLLSPAFGLAGATFPEKIEGLAFGPRLGDGRLLLLVTNDNDFFPTQAHRVYAFAIEDAALPGFRPQTLAPTIDIRPGEGSKNVNLKAGGSLPFAILSRGLFDATGVDPGSLLLGGAALKSPGKGEPKWRFSDCDHDGALDAIGQVAVGDLDLPADAVWAELTGETLTGTPIRGRGAIRLVPPPK